MTRGMGAGKHGVLGIVYWYCSSEGECTGEANVGAGKWVTGNDDTTAFVIDGLQWVKSTRILAGHYGSSLLILSDYASSMPPVLSLPLYMACDDTGHHKELSSIIAWENTKRADIEAKLRRDLSKIKQNTQKNKAGLIHKQAEEKRAMVVAKKSQDNLKADARLAPDSRFEFSLRNRVLLWRYLKIRVLQWTADEIPVDASE
nr:hypothetical protein [Tanacetum cinerariifolium]